MPIYLKNDICEFEPLFELNTSKRQKIVSTVFFKMQENAYKDFSEYTEGIQNLSKYVQKKMKGFRIRLFIEASIYEDEDIMSLLTSLKNIDLVLYHCSDYVRNGKYHKGLFGTIVRFFPMFNFPNNDASSVIISDIDYNRSSYVEKFLGPVYKLFLKCKNKGLDHGGIGKDYTAVSGKKGFFEPYWISDRQVNWKRLDKKVLINYIKNVESMKIKPTFYVSSPIVKKTAEEDFIFGVDEYFIADKLLPYLDKNRPYVYKRDYKILSFLFRDVVFEQTRTTLNSESSAAYIRFLRYVVPEYEENDVIEGIKTIIEAIKTKPHLKKREEDVALRIYEYYIYLTIDEETDDLKYFNREFVEYAISPNMIGTISASVYDYIRPINKLFRVVEDRISLSKDKLSYLRDMI